MKKLNLSSEYLSLLADAIRDSIKNIENKIHVLKYSIDNPLGEFSLDYAILTIVYEVQMGLYEKVRVAEVAIEVGKTPILRLNGAEVSAVKMLAQMSDSHMLTTEINKQLK